MPEISITLCEEVRSETGGTKTLVGVFGAPGIKVKKLPHLFPKFGMFVTSEFKAGFEFSFEIFDPKEGSVTRGTMPKVEGTPATVQFGINFSPFVVKEFGSYRFTVKRSDGNSETVVFEVGQSD